MCDCWRCQPFGPTQEEQDRRLQQYLDAEAARLRHYFESPEGQAVIARNLKKLRRRERAPAPPEGRAT